MLWAVCNPAVQPRKKEKQTNNLQRIYSVYSECEKDTIEKYDHDFYGARNTHTYSIASFDEETNKLPVV